MKIHLVRHGQTPYNRDNLGLGRTDAPLTELGERQAELAAGRLAELNVGQMFTSPLQRAANLADIAATSLSIEAVRCDELLEMDVGDTEGVPFLELRKQNPEFFKAWGGPGALQARMPGGESLEELDARLTPFMPRLEHDEGSDIAVVSHNFVLRALLCRLMGVGLESFRSFNIDLASITTVARDRGGFHVESINDVSHLANLER